MQTIDQALAKLQTSRFRAKFHLTQKDRDYITEKGMDTIRSHAENFIATRLAPAEIPNDGKQTPMRGHPVFLAQHACACCCRGCLEKWYRVPKGRELTEDQQRRIVNLLMTWICREYEKTKMVIDMTKVELAKAYQAPGFRTGKHMTAKDRPRKKEWKREYEKEKGSGRFSGGSSKGGSSDDRTGSFFIGQQSA